MQRPILGSTLLFTLAQDTTKTSNPKAEFSGFLRIDLWRDSRMSNEILDGLFIFYPLPRRPDPRGKDVNANGSIPALDLATRLRTHITSPKILNANALVEADFTGISNNVRIRFRHAYLKLQWKCRADLTLGLTWHPMLETEVFHHVASLNTGAPFQRFNRCPQVTFKGRYAQYSKNPVASNDTA